MENQDINEYIAYAEVAFNNRQFDVSLDWYKKALEENPKDVYVLSRMGAICVSLKQFDDAMKYFQNVLDLNPENGDNYFNLGNAYFFKEDYVNALKYYSMADLKGCSESAKSKLYYQMAILCSLNGDVKSALINYQKFEDCDKSNGVKPKIIKEKIRLYTLISDYDSALNCAGQLILVASQDFDSYAIYFQLLLISKNYSKAEEILNDALKYAKLSNQNKITIEYNKVMLYVAKAEFDKENAQNYYNDALRILDILKFMEGVEQSNLNEALLTSAEIYLKLEQYDEAIECVQEILGVDNFNQEISNVAELSQYDVDNIINDTMSQIEEKIYNGEISEEYLQYAPIEYDENGMEIKVYPEDAFGEIDDLNQDDDDTDKVKNSISKELQDKLDFILLSCYAEKEDYHNALKYAEILKNNEDTYYSYYGIYVEAFATNNISSQKGELKYNEAISFFKTKMLKNPTDKLAVIFRIRLYAEIGKFAKANELVNILSKDDKVSMIEYIEKYKEKYKVKS